jgi:hypothetical protein
VCNLNATSRSKHFLGITSNGADQVVSEGKNSRKLESDAAKHLKAFARSLVLQLYLRRGPFWEAIRGTREKWGIIPEKAVPESSARSFPPGYQWIDEGEPGREEFVTFLREFVGDLNSIHDAIIPDDFRIGGSRRTSRIVWLSFLQQCAIYDPPDAELLNFAHSNLPRAVGVGSFKASEYDPETNTVASTSNPPMMDVPPVASTADAAYVAKIERWFWTTVIRELGIDHQEALERALSTRPDLLNEYILLMAVSPGKTYIDPDLAKSEKDVRLAYRMLMSSKVSDRRSGRLERDPLIAVQCAVFHDKLGWTQKRIANHFGWELSPDDYGARRRSDRVRQHVNLGRQLLGQINPAT